MSYDEAAAARAELPGNVHAADLSHHFHPPVGDVHASAIVTALLAAAFEIRTLTLAVLTGTGSREIDTIQERLGR